MQQTGSEYLTQKEFDDLLEYSTSIPTGTTIGKRWKRHIYTFKVKYKEGDREFYAGYIPRGGEFVSDEWWLGEYFEDFKRPDPKMIGIRWSKIEIAGELEIDKNIKRFEERGRAA